MRSATLLPALAVAVLALAGCGSDSAPQPSPSASSSTPSSTPSASASKTAMPTPTASTTPSVPTTPEPDPSSAAQAAEAPAAPEQQAPAAGEGDVQKFFQTGGQCISDVWSSSMPYTDALQQKVIDYCAANKLGDWSHGIDPMDPKNYGGGQSEPAEKSASTEAEEISKCEALDINTAMSGDIQYCYMEYGISVGEPPATADVAGPHGEL